MTAYGDVLELAGDTAPELLRAARVSIGSLGVISAVTLQTVPAFTLHRIDGPMPLETVLPDFAELSPDKFTNVTNGVPPRRWLLSSNPGLAALVTERLGGDQWTRDLERLRGLEAAADEAEFRERFAAVRRTAQATLAERVRAACGFSFNPASPLQAYPAPLPLGAVRGLSVTLDFFFFKQKTAYEM